MQARGFFEPITARESMWVISIMFQNASWKWRLDRARKQRIPAPLFGSKSDENSDFEGVKQEEFDALKNGDFYYDYGSEFYPAGETKNLCYSRVNSEWRAVQCYTNDVQRNERSCSDLCRAFTLKLRQFPWLFTG